MPWENILTVYANNKGTDQPAYPHSLISAFVVHYLDTTIPMLAKSKISTRLLVFVAEQASLCLMCSQTPEDRFSCDMAQSLLPGIKIICPWVIFVSAWKINGAFFVCFIHCIGSQLSIQLIVRHQFMESSWLYMFFHLVYFHIYSIVEITYPKHYAEIYSKICKFTFSLPLQMFILLILFNKI